MARFYKMYQDSSPTRTEADAAASRTSTKTSAEPNLMKDTVGAASKVAHGVYLTFRTMPAPYMAAVAACCLPFIWVVPIVLFCAPFVLTTICWFYFFAFGAAKTVSHSVDTVETTFSVDIKENKYLKPAFNATVQAAWIIDQTVAPLRTAAESAANIAMATVNQTWKTVTGSAEDLGKTISVKLGEFAGAVWAYVTYALKYIENLGMTHFPKITKWTVEHVEVATEKATHVAKTLPSKIKSSPYVTDAVDAVKAKFS